jgi:hypothetical protein
MKKIILLATVMVCFLATEAQTITKIEGKRHLRSSTEYVNFVDSAVLRYPSTMTVRNLQLDFRFEFTNGNIQLEENDTIIISGGIGNQSFDPERDTIILEEGETLDPGEKFSKLFVFEDQSIGSSFMGILIQENDSTHSGIIHGKIEYVSKYTTTSSETRAPFVLVKEQSTTIPDDTLAVTESIMEKVKFYPNPVTSELNIINLKNTNVEVYNVVGQRISYFEDVSGNLSVEMETLPDGIYFVRMQNGKAVRTEKIKLVK